MRAQDVPQLGAGAAQRRAESSRTMAVKSQIRLLALTGLEKDAHPVPGVPLHGLLELGESRIHLLQGRPLHVVMTSVALVHQVDGVPMIRGRLKGYPLHHPATPALPGGASPLFLDLVEQAAAQKAHLVWHRHVLKDYLLSSTEQREEGVLHHVFSQVLASSTSFTHHPGHVVFVDRGE